MGDGALHDQFVGDVIQGKAGTSTNMNANEVIANRTRKSSATSRGDYHVVHSLDYVNIGQSTNDVDVYPTVVTVAVQFALRRLQGHARVGDRIQRRGRRMRSPS